MSDYKRLTIKDEEYGNYVDNKGSELNKPKVAVSFNGKIHGAVIDRLAELEDKFENGTLIDINDIWYEEEEIKGKKRYIICQHYLIKVVADFANTEDEAKEIVEELQNER